MFIIYHDRFVTATPFVAKRYPVVLKCFTNHQNYPISCREWWFRYDLHPQLHLRIVPFWKVSSSYYPLSTRSSFESKGNPYSFAAVSWSKFRWSSCNWRLKSQTFLCKILLRWVALKSGHHALFVRVRVSVIYCIFTSDVHLCHRQTSQKLLGEWPKINCPPFSILNWWICTYIQIILN